MKKLIYLIVAIVALSLIVAGCGIPVVPPTEQSEPTGLTRIVEEVGKTYYVATTGDDSSGDGSAGNPWATINRAVEKASSGDTIKVAAGVYTPKETILIKVDNLTLIGPQAEVDPRSSYSKIREAGSEEEAIIYGKGLINVILIAANNVVINGFEVRYGVKDLIYQEEKCFGTVVKYNIVHDSDTDEGIQLKNCSKGMIEYNFVYDTAGDALNFASSDNCTIQFNEVHSADNRTTDTFGGAIYTYDSACIDIIGNYIHHTCSHGIVYGGAVKGYETYTPDFMNEGGKVKDNIVSGYSGGDGLVLLSHHTIVEGNEIYGCRRGIQIIGDGISVQKNVLYKNDVGISVIDIEKIIYSTNISAHYNEIVDNAKYGIFNYAKVTVDATCNWWGDNSGPSGAGPGTGDYVSENVIYSPWIGDLVIGDITINPAVVAQGTQTELTAFFTGPTGGTATIDWGDGSTAVDVVDDGAGTVTGSYTYAEAGVYTVKVKITICSSFDTAEYQYVVVYDPSAGFVTGGGWIDSPAGAYKADESLTGKANFGFVSKYKKGQSEPTGNTEFQFKAGDLNFHSDSYDWLVIAGAKAMYKGTGTINGTGEYKFMLSAIDEKLTSSTDVDMFRIKIWDSSGTIYDNQVGDDDDANPSTAISGGQIVIHKK